MLTVGQMARIIQITPKTLRHYEAIGLFSPSAIGQDNQYRYYAPEQIVELRKILFFRSLGLGLEVIRELKESGAMDDTAKITAILQEHMDSIREEIASKQKLLGSVEEMLGTISQTGGKFMKAKVVSLPAFTVVGMSRKFEAGVPNTIPQLWNSFIPRAGEIQGKVNPAVSYGLCDPKAENCSFEYTAGFEVSGDRVPAGMESKTVPARTYAVFTHVGPVSNLSKTFESIHSTWLPQNGYKAVEGIDFELYDERFISPMDEASEVDVYIPIERV